MANWCNNQVFFASYNKDALKKLKKKIKKEGKELLKYHIINSINNINKSKDDNYYYFEIKSSSKYKPSMDDFQVFNYQQDDINLYYQSYDSTNLIAVSNDINNHFFNDKYIIEDWDGEEGEINYFTTLFDLIKWINYNYNLYNINLKLYLSFDQVIEKVKECVEIYNKNFKEDIEINITRIMYDIKRRC